MSNMTSDTSTTETTAAKAPMALDATCFVRHVQDITLAKGLVERPDLETLIGHTIKHGTLPYLLAPSGFGKNTLIKQWLAHQTPCRLLWICPSPSGSTLDKKISLDILSNKSAPEVLKHMTQLANPFSFKGQADALKSSGRSETPLHRPLVIVLENIHALPEAIWPLIAILNQEMQRSLNAQNMPHVQVLCTSQLRIDHEDFLALQPRVIEADQLRLSHQDTLALLQDKPHTAAQTPSQTVAAQIRSLIPSRHDPELINQINGWAILINGLSAMTRANPTLTTTQQKARFSQLSYELIEQEVLHSLSPIEYSVLESMETLPYISQDLCHKIWPGKFSTAVLQNLKKRLLIVVDTRSGQMRFSEQWLNVHFHGRPHRYGTPLHKILQIAAEWYEAHDMIGYALSCYVKLQTWDKVALLAQNHAEALAKGNDWQRVTRWLERLPQSTLAKYPKLMSVMAWQSISLLRKSMATDYISRASAIERPASLRGRPGKGQNSLIHKLERVDVDAEMENLEDLSESLGILLEKKTHDQRHFLVNTMAKKSPHSANLQLHLHALQQLCNWEVPAAASTCVKLIKQAMAERNATLTLNGLYLLGIALYNSSDTKSLAKQSQNVQRWLKDNGFEAHPLAVWATATHCNVIRESGQLDQSEALLQQLEQSFNRPEAPLLHKYTTWMLRAQQHLSRGDISGAQALADRADAIAHQLPLQFTRTMISAPALRADTLILQERYDDARLILDPFVTPYWQSAPEQHDPWALSLYYFLVGIQGDLETMEAQLKLLIQHGAKRKHRVFEFYTRALLCVGLYKAGEHRKARHAVISLAKQLDSRNYYRLLLNRGKDMGNLLLKAGEKPAGQAVVAHWIDLLPKESYSNLLHYDFIKLSKREIEILALITHGLTNEAISNTLCRSLGTVKLHVHNIYKKIGVSSRIQAIQKCEACGFDSELLSCYKRG